MENKYYEKYDRYNRIISYEMYSTHVLTKNSTRVGEEIIDKFEENIPLTKAKLDSFYYDDDYYYNAWKDTTEKDFNKIISNNIHPYKNYIIRYNNIDDIDKILAYLKFCVKEDYLSHAECTATEIKKAHFDNNYKLSLGADMLCIDYKSSTLDKGGNLDIINSCVAELIGDRIQARNCNYPIIVFLGKDNPQLLEMLQDLRMEYMDFRDPEAIKEDIKKEDNNFTF